MSNPHPVPNKQWGTQGAEPMPEEREPTQTTRPTRPYTMDGAVNRMEQSPDLPQMAEHDLWTAVLQNAINDYKGTIVLNGTYNKDRELKAIRAEVTEWFKADNMEVGSFLWICELLNANPTAIRRTVGVK